MQYYKPAGEFFVADCMPFYHDGVFHLYWLLDEKHHQAKGGLGAHQWAHSSSTDLVHWEHHPLAIAIEEEWEGSICTGALFHHDELYYGFYATRKPDRTQHLGVAIGKDPVHLQKTLPNPFASPPAGYSPLHYRDPIVFVDDTGLFHMLVSAELTDYPVHRRGGCLAHLLSDNLHDWRQVDPFIIPGYTDVPECPDYFYWNGWYYLIFSNYGVARYRMSRQPFGPWLTPAVDTFDGPLARVLKTGAYHDNRRIGVAWIGTRSGNKDEGPIQFGGNALFRELVQHADGSLGAKFPAEMLPPSGVPLPGAWSALTRGITIAGNEIELEASAGFAVALTQDLPRNFSFSATVTARQKTGSFGLRLRGSGDFADGYDLRFAPPAASVELHSVALAAVDGLDQPFSLQIVLHDDIIDVCIDHRRCLVNRCPERDGDRLFLFCQGNFVTFHDVLLRPLV
jgi:beta-fructofuranosidase